MTGAAQITDVYPQCTRVYLGSEVVENSFLIVHLNLKVRYLIAI